jgi:MFS family permease
VLTPFLRDEFDLSLRQIGLLLSAAWIGATFTLLPWGLASDRFGERFVLALGLSGSAACLVGAAYAPGFPSLLAALAVSGAAGASVNAASGRAVMHWFGPDERGLALGIRQSAIPVGGLVAALLVPLLAENGGSKSAFLFLAGFSGVGALAGLAFVRGREAEDGLEVSSVTRTLRDGRLVRLCLGSGLYLYSQVAVIGFGVLLLHDEHGMSSRRAALVIAAAQVLAVALRIGAGRWSDVRGSRVGPLRIAGLAVAASTAVAAALATGPVWLLVPALALAGALSMGWNGLAFVAVAELAGAGRSGAAIGFQQSMLSAIGVAAPVLFAATVSSASWTVALLFAALLPLAGWRALRPLRAY